MLTVDHGDGGRLRRDLAHTWDAAAAPAPITPEHEIIVEPGAGWLCSQLDCQVGGGGPGQGVSWLPAGRNCLLAMHDGLLLEYDMAMRAPLGLVAYVDGERVSALARARACAAWPVDRGGARGGCRCGSVCSA